jgi:putative transposase
MIAAAEQLAPHIGMSRACQGLGLPRSNLYRARQKASQPEKPVSGRPQPERALSQEEKEQVCQVLNSERFQDSAPRQVYATLLDEGIYHCSWRTMYRILHENDEVRERRNQLRHPAYSKPELLATKPNQLWSWDTLAPALQVQVSPNSKGRSNGRFITCMSSLMSTVAMLSVGSWLRGNQQPWPSS